MGILCDLLTGGQANLFKSSQIANRKTLGYSALKIANFLCMPVRKSKIRKSLLLIRKSQFRKFLQNTAKLCLKPVFLLDFFYYILITCDICK